MKTRYLMLLATLMAVTSLTPMADEDGHAWMNSAPAFCRTVPYAKLTSKQQSICDEAAFRYLSKNWTTVTASNGQAYEIALDTITRPLPPNFAPRATLRAASVLVYISEGDTFNANNVLQFYFDCHDRFQTFSSHWSRPTYAPPLSIAAKISSVACTHAISRTKQEAKPPSKSSQKSYDPIPPAWSIRIGLPGTLAVGAEYCTQSGKCDVVGNNIVGFTIGGTPVGGVQGCQTTRDAEPCRRARIPVKVLAATARPYGSVIVRLQGTNYGVSGTYWYKREPDGSYVGGPVSIIYHGESMPLQMYLQRNHLWP